MKKKIRTTSIRIISLISSLVILVCCFVVPASATEMDSPAPYQPTFIDLIALTPTYTVEAISGGVVTQSTTTKELFTQVNTAGFDVRFKWGDPESIISHNYLYFCIKGNAQPVSVSLGSRTGVFCGSSSSAYYYKFSVSGNYKANYSILIDLPSSYVGPVGILSAYAVADNSVSINSGICRLRRYTYDSDGYLTAGEVYNENITFPGGTQIVYPAVSGPETLDMFLDVLIKSPVPYADSMSLTLTSRNIWPDIYGDYLRNGGGVQLLTNGSTVSALPYIATNVAARSSSSGDVEYIFTVSVDLTGIELNNSEIVFRFWMGDARSGVTADSPHIYSFNILSCSYQQDTSVKPWYVRFYYWIQNEFTQLKETIESSLGVGQAAPERPDQDQQIQDQIQNNQQTNDDIDNVIGELETAPTLPEFDDTGLDQFDTEVQNQTSPVQPVFVVIFENPLIFQMVTYVFMFALGGFLLYGER